MRDFFDGAFGEFTQIIIGILTILVIVVGTIYFFSSRNEHNHYYLRPSSVSTANGDIGEMSGSVCVQRYFVCYDRVLDSDRIVASFDNQEDAVNLFNQLEYGEAGK